MSSTRKRGRPRSTDPATSMIQVRVTPGQRLELRRVAEDNRTHVSGVIREAVNEYVADYRERRVFVTTRNR
jgi:hypothetical protein